MTTTINVLTYNIHKGFSSGKRFVLPQIREALAELAPDILLLQEVQGMHSRQERRIDEWPSDPQCEFLAGQLWPHYAYGKNAIYQAGHHGNAILSRFPFISWENIDLTNKQFASRSLLHGLIHHANLSVPIHVICIHLGLSKSKRIAQVDKLSQRIANHVPPDQPLIIAGDFNDWRTQATDQLEEELGLQEVFKQRSGKYAKTFPALRPTLRVDRIYYRGLTLLDGQCLDGPMWRALSDHLPLTAQFSLGDERS